jgi:hypothetical protein
LLHYGLVLHALFVPRGGAPFMSHPESLSSEPPNTHAQAKAIYEALKDSLPPTAKGKIVAIERESGDSLVGATILEAARAKRERYIQGRRFTSFALAFPRLMCGGKVEMLHGHLREDEQASDSI